MVNVYLSEFFCFLFEVLFPTKLVHTPLLFICSVILIPVSTLESSLYFSCSSATGIIMMFPFASGTAIPPLVTLTLALRFRFWRLGCCITPSFKCQKKIQNRQAQKRKWKCLDDKQYCKILCIFLLNESFYGMNELFISRKSEAVKWDLIDYMIKHYSA